MNIASNILSDKFFRLAVGFAKSVAIDRKDEKLTPLTLLAGLLIAARHKAQDESAKPVLYEQDRIEKLLIAGAINLTTRAFDQVDTKMPLSHNLREAIKSDGENLERLISALVKLASPLLT